MSKLKAPFPYAGGKSTIAAQIWERLGNTPNYVEPFFGSGAVLLNRPHSPKDETVNDADGLLCNVWRAMQHAPEDVAQHATYPVNECDLHARHLWLCGQHESITLRLMADPDFFDAKAAGWWIWGACSWIGSGWCSGTGKWVNKNGVFSERDKESVEVGESRQLPHIGVGNIGINSIHCQGEGVSYQLPHLGNSGLGPNRPTVNTQEWFNALSSRLKRTRVACGDWSRIMGESVTTKHGLTAVFLDPPYQDGEHAFGYAGGGNVFESVWEWALGNGDNPLLRIAVCGYDDGRVAPDGWETLAWKAQGGYSGQGDGQGRVNATRERIWFSPHCLKLAQGLFGGVE